MVWNSRAKQPTVQKTHSEGLVGNRAGFSSDGTAHLAAKVGRKNWGRQSPAAQRGMGTASPGQGGLFCCCAFGRTLHEVSLLDTGLLRWDTTHSTPGITAVVGDAHSWQLWAQLHVQMREELSNVRTTSLGYHRAFKHDSYGPVLQMWENTVGQTQTEKKSR